MPRIIILRQSIPTDAARSFLSELKFCLGDEAIRLMQISPDDFCALERIALGKNLVSQFLVLHQGKCNKLQRTLM